MWICRQCQTQIEEDDFEMCWNCQSPHSAEGDGQSAGAQAAAGVQPPSPPPLPVTGFRPTCAACSSDRMMHGFELREDTSALGANYRLWAVVPGNDIASGLSSEVRVSICGQCGHVHLTAVNAGAMYRHYQLWLKADEPATGCEPS